MVPRNYLPFSDPRSSKKARPENDRPAQNGGGQGANGGHGAGGGGGGIPGPGPIGPGPIGPGPPGPGPHGTPGGHGGNGSAGAIPTPKPAIANTTAPITTAGRRAARRKECCTILSSHFRWGVCLTVVENSLHSDGIRHACPNTNEIMCYLCMRYLSAVSSCNEHERLRASRRTCAVRAIDRR
jgi:hypothetical protein